MSNGDWSSSTIAEIAAPGPRAIAIGPFGSALKSELYSDSGVPVVRGQDITDGHTLSLKNRAYVPEEVASRFPACIVREGDLVFPHRGSIGRVAIIGSEEMLLSSSMMKLTVDADRVDARFIFYFFRGKGREELLARASTVGTPGIGQPLTSLRSISLTLPPKNEQCAIAEVLGALDDKIATNDCVVQRAEELAAAVAGTSPSTARVSDLARHYSRAAAPSSFNPSVALFSLPAFDDGAEPEIVGRGEIKSNKLVLTEPVALVSKLNPRIPRVWNVNRLPEVMAVASTEFVVLAPLEISSCALWAALRDPSVSTELAGRVAGTSGSHQRVKPVDVLGLLVPDPRELPVRARAEVDALGDMAHAYRSERKPLVGARDELLPLLMSGKIRVKDAEKVVEEVL